MMLPTLNQLSALVSVLIIDVVLAGDNAIVVGMAAAGMAAARRRQVIFYGIAAATLLRILLAYFALELLAIIGLTLAGGVLLLWVSWKMYRELREAQSHRPGAAHASQTAKPPEKTTFQAMTQIVVADLSMSLDNVIAVAGVAHTQTEPWVLRIPGVNIELNLVLIVGLVLSVALMGVASTFIARLLARYFWISWIGLGIITIVAVRMIWHGWAQIAGQTAGL